MTLSDQLNCILSLLLKFGTSAISSRARNFSGWTIARWSHAVALLSVAEFVPSLFSLTELSFRKYVICNSRTVYMNLIMCITTWGSQQWTAYCQIRNMLRIVRRPELGISLYIALAFSHSLVAETERKEVTADPCRLKRRTVGFPKGLLLPVLYATKSWILIVTRNFTLTEGHLLETTCMRVSCTYSHN
jgi:hypothetical protein